MTGSLSRSFPADESVHPVSNTGDRQLRGSVLMCGHSLPSSDFTESRIMMDSSSNLPTYTLRAEAHREIPWV